MTTTAIIDSIDMQINALIKAGYYSSKMDITKDAFRVLFETRANLKVVSAVELYKSNKISLSRGAEIAGQSIEEFKEVLVDRGIFREIKPDTESRQNVTEILEARD